LSLSAFYTLSVPPFPINYLFVFLAAVVHMLVGFLWYSSVLFGKRWSTLMGYTSKSLKEAQTKMGPLYGLSFLAALVTSYVLALIVNFMGAATYAAGATAGFWVWLGFIFPVQLTGEIFNSRPFSPRLLAINTGYQLVSLLLMGALLARWV
jgi:hypothetical protein